MNYTMLAKLLFYFCVSASHVFQRKLPEIRFVMSKKITNHRQRHISPNLPIFIDHFKIPRLFQVGGHSMYKQ